MQHNNYCLKLVSLKISNRAGRKTISPQQVTRCLQESDCDVASRISRLHVIRKDVYVKWRGSKTVLSRAQILDLVVLPGNE